MHKKTIKAVNIYIYSFPKMRVYILFSLQNMHTICANYTAVSNNGQINVYFLLISTCGHTRDFQIAQRIVSGLRRTPAGVSVIRFNYIRPTRATERICEKQKKTTKTKDDYRINKYINSHENAWRAPLRNYNILTQGTTQLSEQRK